MSFVWAIWHLLADAVSARSKKSILFLLLFNLTIIFSYLKNKNNKLFWRFLARSIINFIHKSPLSLLIVTNLVNTTRALEFDRFFPSFSKYLSLSIIYLTLSYLFKSVTHQIFLVVRNILYNTGFTQYSFFSHLMIVCLSPYVYFI